MKDKFDLTLEENVFLAKKTTCFKYLYGSKNRRFKCFIS